MRALRSMLWSLVPLLGIGGADVLAAPRARPAPPSPTTAPPTKKGARRVPDLARCAQLYQARRYRAAQACFAGHVTGPATDPVILYALGYCHYQLAEYHTALARFREALRRQPRDGDTHFMLGVTLAKLRRYKPALRSLRQALAVGLRSESPTEARRYVKLLRSLLRAGPKPGLRWHLGAYVGYDSHPRLDGRAAIAGTSDGSTSEGSGFATLEAGIGYQLRLGRRGWATAAYAFRQRLVFNDLSTSVIRQAGRYAVSPPELSLQAHRASLQGRLAGSRWSVGLQVGGEVELTGLNRFTGSLAALPLAVDARALWHRRTNSQLAVGLTPQWALDTSLDYLSGTLLWLEATQRLTWGRLVAGLGYRYTAAWLGTAEQTEADCPMAVVCTLSAPYGHQAHGVRLTLKLRATRWLRLGASAGVTHRRFAADTVFRLQGGRDLRIRRTDLTQRYDLGLDFTVARGLQLLLHYTFDLTFSTITEEETGLEEGYQRHLVTLGLRYRR